MDDSTELEEVEAISEGVSRSYTVPAEKPKGFFTRFYEKHEGFLSVITVISWVLAGIYAFIAWVTDLFNAFQDSSFIGFIILLVLKSFIMMFYAAISFVFIWAVLFLVAFLPYLLWRGLVK